MTHRLIAYARRNMKNHIATSLAETYAMRGEHTHLASVAGGTCYNGTSFCDKFVDKRLHWNGSAFASSGGESGDK